MDIQNMIEKYGPEITKTLKIASTQLYDKILWYVRADGIVGLVETVLIVIFILFCIHIILKIEKQTNWFMSGDPALMVYVIMLGFAPLIFGLFVCEALVPNISRETPPQSIGLLIR